MTKKYHNNLHNADERQLFKKRKSKKYKNLCSLAVTTLAVAGLATTTTAQADENTVSTTPATNLVSVQPASSEEHAETQAQANTETGVLEQPIVSPELNNAVLDAKEAGVSVTEETTPVKHETLESAENDLTNQLHEVEAATTKQEANTAAIVEAEKKNQEIDEANRLEDQRVEEENKKGQALVDDINKKGQEDTAANNAKLDEFAAEANQALVVATEKLNSAKKEYTDLYNEQGQHLTDEINKIGQAGVTDVKAAEAQINALGEQAVAERNRLGEQVVNAENEIEKLRVAAENSKKQAEHAQNLVESQAREAENQAIRERNKAGQEAVDKRNAEAEKAYEERLKQYEATNGSSANTNSSASKVGQEGYLVEEVIQALKFESEPEAEFSVVAPKYGTTASLFHTTGSGFLHNGESANERDDSFNPHGPSLNYFSYSNNPVVVENPEYDKGAGNGEGIVAVVAPNESTTATYTNLKNSTYKGEPISKVTYKVTNLNTKTGTVMFGSDPTNGIFTNVPEKLSDFKVEIQFFDKDGNVITATKEAPIVFGFASLTRTETIEAGSKITASIEGISNYNFRPVLYNYGSNPSSKIEIFDSKEELAASGLIGTGRSESSHEKVDDRLDYPFIASNVANHTIRDNYYNKDFYQTAFAAVFESGDTITFNMSKQGSRNMSYWLGITSKVPNDSVTPYDSTSVRPKPPTPEVFTPEPELPPVTASQEWTPIEPVLKTFTPEVYTPIALDKDFTPVTFTPKTYTPEVAPKVNIDPFVYTPVTYTPVTPVYQPHVEVPEKVTYTVATHPVLVSQKPSVTKEVTNLAMVNIDGQTIPKGSIVTFKVTADNLLAGREETTGFKYIDPFAGGLEILKEETVAANAGGHFTLAVNENGVYELIGTKATENLLNSNRMTADVTPPSGYFVARVTNDGATYSNTAPVIITTPSGEYKAVSNTVTVSTPDPANPQKAAKNNEGVVINGKPVVVGSTIFYTITLDYDQYANLTADDSIIKAGFGAFDDYPEDALTVDLEGATFSTLSGKAVTGLTVKDNSSVSVADDVTKQLLSSSQIGGKVSGAFISVIADDPISYYNDIVKKNEKVVVTIPMTVKTELYNTGKSFENIAYQVDFGHGYVTNTVTNTTPVVTPTKNNTNSQGVLINGKYVLANSVNYYKVNLDYSDYKGIEADTDFISQGFYAVDDYPEDALTVDTAGIQLFTSDNKLVNGMTSKVYESLLQAPAALQQAMAKQGFATKGAVLVLSADDPQAFYEAYVKTGKQLTAVLPMTVKAELAKTGGRYENTAYQVDFGTAYVTNTVVNNVPKIDPKKDVVLDLTNQKDSLNGKDIEIGSFLTYKLVGSDIPSDRGTELFSYFWEDDYDETKDQYEGVFKVYADTDITLKDGTKLIGGDGLQTELTRFVIQEVDYTTGKVHTKFDESFLKSISDDSAFKATLYLQMKRIASGDAYNTATHGVNDARVDTNTVVTHTPVGSVLVNYLEDGTGKVLKSQVVDEKEVPTGTPYDTNDQELSQIVTEDGKTYELIRVDGKEVGKVVKGDTIVDYIYKEVKGTVTVHYVDDKGNVIKTPVVDTPETSTGTDYDTTDNKPKTIMTEDGKTFELVPDKTKGAETGKVVKGDTPITYVYTEAKGTVTVHYVDENGNVIKTPVVDTPETSTGTDYDTTDNKPKTITTEDGKTFELVPDKTKGAETGKVVKGDTSITYVYREVKPDAPTPKVEEKGKVTVHYIDENGNIIKTPVVDTPDSPVGTVYDTTDNKPKTITTEDGRTYELVPDKTKGAETGKVVKGDTPVTYVYKEVKGTVTVHYVDENGNVIKTPVVDTPESPTGTDYDTTDNKPKTITTEDGKTYELVRVEGNESGKVVKGDTPVTYVYREVKPKATPPKVVPPITNNTPVPPSSTPNTTTTVTRTVTRRSLPETGDHTDVAVTLVGVGAVLGATQLASYGIKKREEQDGSVG